jgi:hypothetical protein
MGPAGRGMITSALKVCDNAIVDSIHQFYIGHCPLSEVSDTRDISEFHCSPVFRYYTDRFLLIF